MTSRSKTVALIVAAGSGTRAGGDLPKQYRRIGGRALIAHAVDHLDHPAVDEIVVVIAPGQQALLADALGDRKIAAVVEGGATRQQSVRNGLEHVERNGGADIVLIHDAARAFLSAEVVERLIARIDERRGAVPALAVVDTLAKADDILGSVVPRGDLVRVQTPQGFRFDDILAAHRAWPGEQEATDDAQIARAAGIEVAVVEGDSMLEKLTYDADFARAEARLSAGLVSRTGLGFDVHAFDEGDGVWLGGVLVPHSKRLKGHSDADVVLHAITDAVLGAIGQGDIGDHFPPSDPQWRGAASHIFLAHARNLVEAAGGRIDHVDVTVICEAPKIGPHRAAIRESITAILGLKLSSVSVKATTSEQLGFTGRREGIAAQAIATVRVPEDA